MYELAGDLREKGHTVTVLTSFPGYNLSGLKACEGIGEMSNEQGILVLRASTMQLKKVNYLRRGLAEVALPYNFQRLLKRYEDVSEFDAIWVLSPPLPLALLGAWIKRSANCPFILNAQDLFPQNAIDLGIIKNRLVIACYEFMERLAYRSSDFVMVHSVHNRDFLIKRKMVPSNKVFVQYNWIDMVPFEKAHRTGRFRKRFGIKDETVVLFGGVLGPSQGLEVVVQLAERFRGDDSLRFLLVGDGTRKRRIQTMVKTKKLENVIFAPFVSKEEYPFLVKDADIGLSCLSAEVKTPVVPGKIQGYMAACRPILGILNRQSDGHQLISEAGAGISVVAGDFESAVRALYRLKSDAELRNHMGQAGYRYARMNLERSRSVDNILDVLGVR